ncbi:MAG: hypothetical protein LBE20_07090 [Deltaproteobacteria bacterium]|jgi:hypothetical protein|nr:hypothetical protein [Deltaproteobacteria bacterium]
MSTKDYNQRYQGLNTKHFKKILAKQVIAPAILEKRKAAGSLIGKIGKIMSKRKHALLDTKKILVQELNEINRDIKVNSKGVFIIIPTRILSSIFAQMSGLLSALKKFKNTKEKQIQAIEAKILELEMLIANSDSNTPTLMFARSFYDQGEYDLAKAIAEKLLPEVLQKTKEWDKLVTFSNPKYELVQTFRDTESKTP